MIAVLRACGDTVEEVAQAIGLSEPTLRKYYFRELDDAPSLAKAALIRVMWKKALEGNVSAARFIREEFPKGDAAAFLRQAAEADKQASSPKVGKKVQAELDAQSGHEGSGWAGLLQ